jgi:hypothetical protein
MFFACSGGRGMRRTTMLWEVFVTRFAEAFEQYEKRRLTGEEAGELLGQRSVRLISPTRRNILRPAGKILE